MSVWEAMTQWSGSGRALANAQEATLELAGLRREREEVASFLTEALEGRVLEALAADA